MGKNNITIYTQNLKNHFKLIKGISNMYDGKTIDSCLNLSRYLAEKDIDFTSLQEMTCDRNHYLQTKFADVMWCADRTYKQEPFFNLVTGKSRLPRILLTTYFGISQAIFSLLFVYTLSTLGYFWLFVLCGVVLLTSAAILMPIKDSKISHNK